MTARASRSRVLVAGGGVAALEAALALRHLAADLVDVELLAPETHFWYRPLAVVEPFGGGRLHGIELAELADACGARFSPGLLAAVEPAHCVARTAAGVEIEYDALLIAAGATPVEAVPGAFTFRGPAEAEAFGRLLAELDEGQVQELVFAVPGGVAWPLPLYELALQTASHLRRQSNAEARLTLVTHEETPLEVFGAEASAAVARLLRAREIAVETHRYAVAFRDRKLELVPPLELRADRAVALARLRGTPIEGIPHDRDGFIPTDEHGRVRRLDDVFAAGDATAFPVKQGGLAAQQADAAAEWIAASLGAPVDPQPFRPVLRGLLVTGGVPAFVRAELAGGSGSTSVADTEALWWPPGKIVGRYLAPFLAERAETILEPPASGLPVEVDVPSAT